MNDNFFSSCYFILFACSLLVDFVPCSFHTLKLIYNLCPSDRCLVDIFDVRFRYFLIILVGAHRSNRMQIQTFFIFFIVRFSLPRYQFALVKLVCFNWCFGFYICSLFYLLLISIPNCYLYEFQSIILLSKIY